MNLSNPREFVTETEPLSKTWGRHWPWLPALWLPILWFSVWCVVVGLVAWERRLTSVDSPAAQLGWLPVFVATLLMSLYLQWQQREASPSLRPWLLYVRFIQYFVWIVVVWFLGGWETSLLGLLVLVTGELQSWVLMQTEGTSAQVFSDNSASPAGKSRVDKEIGKEIEEEIEGENDEEIEELDLDDGQDDSLGESDHGSDLGTWLQKMTRRVIDSETGSMAQPDRLGLPEQIEWFGRHTWRVGQVQVDLHVPFQPAFLTRPEVEVAVVEGAGEAHVGDVLPQGVRVQLKRAKLEENTTGSTVIWLQATGPVEP